MKIIEKIFKLFKKSDPTEPKKNLFIEKSEPKKVYCYTCYWYNQYIEGGICGHEKNIVITHTPICPIRNVIEKPEVINKNNDCSLYKNKYR